MIKFNLHLKQIFVIASITLLLISHPNMAQATAPNTILNSATINSNPIDINYPVIHVFPNQPISGSMDTSNHDPCGSCAPIPTVGVNSWDNTSFTDLGYFPSDGNSYSKTFTFSFTAPSTPGDYYIAVMHRECYTTADVVYGCWAPGDSRKGVPGGGDDIWDFNYFSSWEDLMPGNSFGPGKAIKVIVLPPQNETIVNETITDPNFEHINLQIGSGLTVTRDLNLVYTLPFSGSIQTYAFAKEACEQMSASNNLTLQTNTKYCIDAFLDIPTAIEGDIKFQLGIPINPAGIISDEFCKQEAINVFYYLDEEQEWVDLNPQVIGLTSIGAGTACLVGFSILYSHLHLTPIAVGVSNGVQATGTTTILGTCGLSFPDGNSVNYGALIPNTLSSEVQLNMTNSGTVNATLFVAANPWEDISFNDVMHANVTHYNVTAAQGYANNTGLESFDKVVTSIFDPAVTLQTYWELFADLIDPSFTGSATQTMDFTVSC